MQVKLQLSARLSVTSFQSGDVAGSTVNGSRLFRMEHDNRPVTDRRAQRIRSFLGAKIVLSGGYSVFDCLVKDISDAGARLKVEDVVAIPEKFELQIVDGRRYECTVRWRRLGFIGVEFRVG